MLSTVRRISHTFYGRHYGSSNGRLVEGPWPMKTITKTVMLTSLQTQGHIKTSPVMSAMSKVDRASYTVDPDTAYIDQPQGVGFRQAIEAPCIHAMALEALSQNLLPGASVLDIGTGSGYITACLAQLIVPGGRCYSVERVNDLLEWGKQNMQQANPELMPYVKFVHGDGLQGYQEGAPYDVIYVGGAVTEIPKVLLDQLKEGGRMTIPVSDPSVYRMNSGFTNDQSPFQNLVRVDKIGGKIYQSMLTEGVRFSPLQVGVTKS